MAQFHLLTVTAVEKTTRDAVVVTLAAADPAPFAFTQGQYLTFRRQVDGAELRRAYSICAGRGEGVLQVGIKRVDGGAFSTWANTELAVGDVIEALPPMGQFYAASEGDAPHLLLIAAGSGITPILSILKTTLAEQPDARVTLIYGNRTPGAIMFRETLEDLKNQHMGRLSVLHILSDDSQDIPLFQGRIDADKCAALFRTWVDVGAVSTAYLCGPEAMMHTVSAALQAHGLDKGRIRFELFGAGQAGRAPRKAASPVAAHGLAGQVTYEGETRTLPLDAQTSLLEAALAHAVDAPFACKAGVCSTCKAKVTEGEVEMVANHALEDYEVEAGYVLTCQCYPLSQKVAWDYDQAGH